jgi:hypothetical protein
MSAMPIKFPTLPTVKQHEVSHSVEKSVAQVQHLWLEQILTENTEGIGSTGNDSLWGTGQKQRDREEQGQSVDRRGQGEG